MSASEVRWLARVRGEAQLALGAMWADMRKRSAPIALMVLAVASISCGAGSDQPADSGLEVFDVEMMYAGRCEGRGAPSSVLFWNGDAGTAWIDVGGDGSIDGVRDGSEVSVRWAPNGGSTGERWYSFDLTSLETAAFARTLDPVARVSPLLDPTDHPFEVVREWRASGLESPVRLFDDVPDSPVVEWATSGDEVTQVTSKDPNPEVGFPASTKFELRRRSTAVRPPHAQPATYLGEANAAEMLADSQLSNSDCSGYSSREVECRLSEARELSVERWIMQEGPVGSTGIGGC